MPMFYNASKAEWIKRYNEEISNLDIAIQGKGEPLSPDQRTAITEFKKLGSKLSNQMFMGTVSQTTLHAALKLLTVFHQDLGSNDKKIEFVDRTKPYELLCLDPTEVLDYCGKLQKTPATNKEGNFLLAFFQRQYEKVMGPSKETLMTNIAVRMDRLANTSGTPNPQVTSQVQPAAEDKTQATTLAAAPPQPVSGH